MLCIIWTYNILYKNRKKRSRIYDIYQIIMDIFKIGAFTFGGGYAMLPLVESEVVGTWVVDE